MKTKNKKSQNVDNCRILESRWNFCWFEIFYILNAYASSFQTAYCKLIQYHMSQKEKGHVCFQKQLKLQAEKGFDMRVSIFNDFQ